jgi:hypothetical protein
MNSFIIFSAAILALAVMIEMLVAAVVVEHPVR